MLQQALYISCMAHAGMTDKAGEPYFLHCVRVMERVRSYGEPCMVVAVLHDVLEDTNCIIHHHRLFPFEQDMALTQEVEMALVAITRQKGEEYFNYIKRVGANPLATKVKLADLADNLDPVRFESLSEKDKDRLEPKYNKAKQQLKEIHDTKTV